MSAPVLLWHRQDLRLSDHPALYAALQAGAPVIPVYVLDDDGPGQWRMGGASRWWLHPALAALDASLRALGSRLILRRGRPAQVLAGLLAETGASAIHFTRAYEPWAVADEQAMKQAGLPLRRFGGALLFEPEDIRNRQDQPFRVFTPFWNACLQSPPPKRPLPAPQSIPAPARWPESDRLDDWSLLPSTPDWAGGLRAAWTPGEASAHRRLDDFIDEALSGYARMRDRPDRDGTSRLSPHLHFGEISPRQIWHSCAGRPGADALLRELGWREFSTHLLVLAPDLPDQPLRREFSRFPWRRDTKALLAWRQGLTGYPIVDAGMRQLWQTGWMHNRVRMVAASFLIKHLLLPWQAGEAWFWDTLVDADLANNAASWQWVAGCGADAAPYFRIFNPVLQGQKFDPNGDYVRHFVPELAHLPADLIHTPWKADAPDYPAPIVEHGLARERALAALAEIRVEKA